MGVQRTSTRKIIALAAPLVVACLTWSMLGGQARTAVDAERAAEQVAEQVAEQALHLDGTAIAGKWRMAIIDGERVFEGQAFRGRFRLSEVGTDSVTLTAPSGEMTQLSLDIARLGPAAAVPSSRARQ